MKLIKGINMNHHIHQPPKLESLVFLDFYSFSDLEANPRIFTELVDAYQKIFAEPGIWEEQYSYEDIVNKLQREMLGYACLRACLDVKGQNLVGFCWVQVIEFDEMVDALNSVEYCQRSDVLELSRSLSQKIGNATLIYIHDLGIVPEYRKRVSLVDLIHPAVKSVAHRSGITKILFWSSPQTCIHHLAEIAEIPMIVANGDIQFFCGDIRNDRLSTGFPIASKEV